jgi:hypothetical protein
LKGKNASQHQVEPRFVEGGGKEDRMRRTDVAELMQLIDSDEHLGDVESGMLLLEDSRVVEERTEVSSRDVFLQDSTTSR